MQVDKFNLKDSAAIEITKIGKIERVKPRAVFL